MNNFLLQEIIEQRILIIRGQKVMLDRDLARLYGVTTKALNQAVKRNIKRFPEDFMFSLNESEKNEVVTNCDHLRKLKFSRQLPYAFTEQGVAMLSNVLKSQRAIQVNIAIMRTFVKLRQILSTHKYLADKFKELERKFEKHDEEIKSIFEVLKNLAFPPEKPKPRLGF
jgi:phage regulator Rha-like protein